MHPSGCPHRKTGIQPQPFRRLTFSFNFGLGLDAKLAGTRPGGRGPFLLHDKKGPKEACPTAPALHPSGCLHRRAALATARPKGRPLNSPSAQTTRPDFPLRPSLRSAGPRGSLLSRLDSSDAFTLKYSADVFKHGTNSSRRKGYVRETVYVGELLAAFFKKNDGTARAEAALE